MGFHPKSLWMGVVQRIVGKFSIFAKNDEVSAGDISNQFQPPPWAIWDEPWHLIDWRLAIYVCLKYVLIESW